MGGITSTGNGEQDAMIAHPPGRLEELAGALGEPLIAAGNRPIRLDAPDAVWFVERGALDVFLAEYRDGEAVSTFHHLLRAGSGRLVFGVGAHGDGAGLQAIAKGLPGTRLRRLRLHDLDGKVDAGVLAAQVDAWLAAFTAALVRDVEPRPHPDVLLGAGQRLEVAAAGVLSADRGVVWVTSTAGAGAAFLGTEEPEEQEAGTPLTPESWLTLPASTSVRGVSTRELCAARRLVSALAAFHRLALAAEQLNRRLLLADEANLQTAGSVHRRRDEDRARAGLFAVLARRRPGAQEPGAALLGALRAIGRHEGIVFHAPPARRAPSEEGPALSDVLRASGVRARAVRLALQEHWWRGDSGALLGFRRDDGRPVALLPGIAGRYRMLDPVTGRLVRVDAARARALLPEAWFCYRPLPSDRAARARDLLRVAGRNLAADFVRFAGTGLLVGVLTMAPAVVVGVLADRVLPAGAGGVLRQLTVALVALAGFGGLLRMWQGTAQMRIEGRTTVRIGAALWDRLLGLPASFFRRYTAGELASRVMVFQTLRDRVSGVVANALLAVVFMLPSFALIFIHDVFLGWLSLGIGLCTLTLALVFGALQIAPQRRLQAATRRLTGMLLQFIGGIGKLRSNGAEGSAYASWARIYRQQKQAELRIGSLTEHLVAFSAALPALAGAALFAGALRHGPGALAAGDFLAVYAVSMLFYLTVVAFGQSFEAVAAVVPAAEQVRPVLAAVPEALPEGDAAVELSGALRFDHVSFRYSGQGPAVLTDVCIDARPGEMVAIVGESGSGKSTLLRLALGLEAPAAGAVYFDGHDLTHLNRRALRSQIGVVVQDGALQPGTVLDNIIGTASDLTVDDAWRAARLAAVDGDLAAMPMGLYTLVGDSAATFSGGQAQRIRIAAALVRNPRVVFLDEATSWLDAESQSEVMRGIERLLATRIVIAHRLSTIRNADRIYVLQAGRVVQHGGFDELLATGGVFRDLMRRQMA